MDMVILAAAVGCESFPFLSRRARTFHGFGRALPAAYRNNTHIALPFTVKRPARLRHDHLSISSGLPFAKAAANRGRSQGVIGIVGCEV